MNGIFSNLELNIFYSKISLDIIKKISISTFDNKYIRNIPILQFLFEVLASSIDILNFF